MAGYKSQLQKTCGDQEYDTLKENLHKGIEEAKRFEHVNSHSIQFFHTRFQIQNDVQ